MNAPVELVSVLTGDEAEEIMRSDIVALLSLDPHHELAQFFGQALADLYGS